MREFQTFLNLIARCLWLISYLNFQISVHYKHQARTAELAKVNETLHIEITEHKRAEEALRREKDKLEGALSEVKKTLNKGMHADPQPYPEFWSSPSLPLPSCLQIPQRTGDAG